MKNTCRYLKMVVLAGLLNHSITVYGEARNLVEVAQEECECEGGIPFMTVRYNGDNGVNINVYANDKQHNLITSFFDVQSGSLLKLDGSRFMDGVEKTRRWFSIEGNENNAISFHTSCSENILGQTLGNFTVVSYTDRAGNTCGIIEEELSAISTANNIRCFDTQTGSIELKVSGGKEPYSFKWSNGSTSQNLSGVSSGFYSVIINDANGQSFEASAEILEADPIDAHFIKNDVNCSSTNSGSIELMVSGGSSPYTYQWAHGPTTKDVSDLSSGNYSVEISDMNDCKITKNIQIEEAQNLEAYLYSDACFNNYLIVDVNGGLAPYTYLWSNGSTSPYIDYLEKGDYSIIVSDAAGCQVKLEEHVTGNDESLVISTSIAHPTCDNTSGGSVDVSVSGGVGPYSFSWSNGSSSEDLSGVSSGNYHLTITDAYGCSESINVTIQDPVSIEIYASNYSRISCFGKDDGSLDVVVTGGTAPYTYEWSNGSSESSQTNLSSGIYEVVVTDGLGCKRTASFYIDEPNPLYAHIDYDVCSGGTADLKVSGGTAPYTFKWSNGVSSEDLSDPEPGDYSVTITDARGCTIETELYIGDPIEPLVLELTALQPTCNSINESSINLSVVGGEEPYVIRWSNGEITEDLENISPGVYSVIVQDFYGCSTSASIEINEPNAPEITVIKNISESCAGNDGQLEILINGGLAPYVYQWTGDFTTSSLENLNAGEYTVIVTDSKGCTVESTVIVQSSEGNSNPPVASFSTCSDQVICRGGTAAIEVHSSAFGEWSFTYTDGIDIHRITTFENPYLLDVSPEQTTTYTLVAENSSCNLEYEMEEVTVLVNECSTVSKASKSCTDCFDTRILEVKDSGYCSTITMEVSADNSCNFALSHFTVAVPCGNISAISNSRGWPTEIVEKDPTTGLRGFKVDNIQGFGNNKSSGKFTVTYTVCKEDCEEVNTCGALVAYKAGQCLSYEKAGWEEQVEGLSSTLNAYPNPIDNTDVTISLKNFKGKEVTVSVKDMSGTEYYSKVFGLENGEKLLNLEMLKSYPRGIYLLIITSQDDVHSQRLFIK